MSAITEKLLADTDCRLTLFARHANDAGMFDPRISVVNGDAADAEDLAKVLSGHDVVYCAISGDQLPVIAQNVVDQMAKLDMRRLIFMGAVGIYNEIPDEIDGQDNVNNNPSQIPNRQAVDIIEASDLNYTIVRPGYLRDGAADDFSLTVKGEPAQGYITTIPSVAKLAMRLIEDDGLYVRESVGIARVGR